MVICRPVPSAITGRITHAMHFPTASVGLTKSRKARLHLGLHLISALSYHGTAGVHTDAKPHSYRYQIPAQGHP